jgi:large subunit ribosomal protein L3
LKKAILAVKIGMTQIFDENGIMVPVTVLEAGPCVVTQRKTVENDGYAAVQVGFGDVKVKNVTKPEMGHFSKAGVEPKRYLREFKLEGADGYEPGTVIKADIFEKGDRVDVSGTSKGKGFAGGIKKYGYSRGPMSHGSKYHRHSGAMAGATTPGKVKKGKGLPSQMGAEAVTIQNLDVVRVDAERNLLLVKGAVPGARGSLVAVKETVKV